MQSGLSSHGCRRIRAERLRAGFALVEVLIALFVVALGIAGAAGLQTLAVRAGRDATRLSDATRSPWNRESSALERTGSGVSWRPNWPGAHEP